MERYNEEVRQNRQMLKNIGEAVLYLAKQELAFRGHDESSKSLNQGNYRELLKCFGKLDSVFDYRLHGRLSIPFHSIPFYSILFNSYLILI